MIGEGTEQCSRLGVARLALTADLTRASELGRDRRGTLVIEVTGGSPAEQVTLALLRIGNERALGVMLDEQPASKP